LPTNPNAREILGFRFSRRTELLRYAIKTYVNLRRFDRAVAAQIRKLFRAGEFPLRREHVFFLGARQLPSRDPGHDSTAKGLDRRRRPEGAG
jgi:hypothetical protein